MVKCLICIQCGGPREIGRRICSSCNKKRLIAHIYSHPRYKFNNVCYVCHKEFIAWRKKQKACISCRKIVVQLHGENNSNNNYNTSKGIAEHRYIAEYFLNRKLLDNEIVHHINNNSRNNDKNNLSVMSIETHGRLHLFLSYVKAFYHYNDGIELFNRNIKNLTIMWSIEAREEIIFL